MENYFEYIGLRKFASKNKAVQPFIPAATQDIAEKYLDYLKELDHYQKERRTTIEGKNSQLVGQASIVTSIFSLFVPLLVDKFNDLSWWISIPFSLIFLFVLAHYLLTILHSIRTLKIDKYKYPTRNTNTLTKAARATTVLDFMNEEITDLIYIIDKATPIDNDKGQNLIFATRCFEIANVGFGILSVAIIVSTFFMKSETEKQEIKEENLNELVLNVPDTMNKNIINYKEIDCINVKIDTTKRKIYKEQQTKNH